MKKKLVMALLLFVILQPVQAQISKADSLFHKASNTSHDSVKINTMIDLFELFELIDHDALLNYTNKFINHAMQKEDKVMEALALNELSWVFTTLRDLPRSDEISYKALKIAEKTGNQQLIGNILNLIASGIEDNMQQALVYYRKSLALTEAANAYREQIWSNHDLTYLYIEMNKLDSALFRAQRAYELTIRHRYQTFLSTVLRRLGAVHYELGNKTLAKNFYHMAINEAQAQHIIVYTAQAYYALANYFYRDHQRDSALYYAYLSLQKAYQGPSKFQYVNPSKLLYNLYKGSNSDSALKYMELYLNGRDSVYSTENLQRLHALRFGEELRQKELAIEKEKQAEERRNNLQYLAIGTFIVSFIIIMIMLSRIKSSIKVVKFMGALGLLLVFEFISLLLHPLIGNLTHHIPVFFLMVSVIIASVLVPLHHYFEHEIKQRLIKKRRTPVKIKQQT